jgi:UDP-N-acetylglucosamine acyltransferase
VIDARAIIDKNARIAKNVTIGPYTIIGEDVEIGEGTWIGPHVVIKGSTKIGKNNKIFQFASVGEDPQDKKYQGEKTILEMGDENIIREFVTINRGTLQGGGKTVIGNDNLLMAYVHIAHDCYIKDHTIFGNNASLSGHVIVENHAILSGFSLTHQYCVIGAYSFVAAATGISKDVLPYILVSGVGHDSKVFGLNVVGLKRHGFTDETISHLKRAYKIIFRQNLTVAEAIVELKKIVKDCPEIQIMLEQLEKSERGISR